MKICFIICGQPRCIDLVIKNIEELFFNYELSYLICITNNYNYFEKEYSNNFDINKIIQNKNINKLLLVNDNHNSDYRNSKNYCKKIVNILKILENKYDLFIIIRSDFIFFSINFLENIVFDNKIYICNKRYNQYTKNENNKCNDNIIICKNFDLIKKLENIDKYLDIQNNYLEISLFNYFKEFKIQYEEINIDYKLILSRCNIIAIAGDSGSGKTTLLNELSELFEKNNFLKLETDRYHKWERGSENYLQFTHLNPEANNLEKMSNDVYNLKIGSEIYTVDYDHNTGKFTQEETIESRNNVILCGLHTLYNDRTNELIDLKIFMDTDRELIKKWKIKRDVEERGYNLEKVLKQIETREKDYEEYIKNQKDNADIIINFYEENEDLKCKIIVKNSNFIKKMILSNIYNNFECNKNLIIKLNENYYSEIKKMINVLYDII